jgi:hypothetical protein
MHPKKLLIAMRTDSGLSQLCNELDLNQLLLPVSLTRTRAQARVANSHKLPILRHYLF